MALYPGSRVPDQGGLQENLRALRAEHRFLIAIFRDLEQDTERKISDPLTLSACAAACSVPDYHNEEVIEAWGEDAVLRGACGTMLSAVKQLIEDQKARFGDNTIWSRLTKAVGHREPFPDEDAGPQPF